MNTATELRRARALHASEAWLAAHAALSGVDRVQPLKPDDLERLATAAYMLGREAEYLEILERAQRDYAEKGNVSAAFRCAFWVGISLARRGEVGPASGWLRRAERLLDEGDRDSVERGYLLLPAVFRHESSGEWEDAAAIAGEAVAIGEQHGDLDLLALAGHEQGHVLIRAGRINHGLTLLDEAMVSVAAGEVSPIVSGIVYCGVILACQEARDVRRAQQWTAALSDWCERQPDLVAFTGRCLVHRAELLQLHGSWSRAFDEAQRAADRCEEGENPLAAGEACYLQAEIHRSRGELDAAEAAYREASDRGREPQPGLALLRLAQGRTDAAEAAIRRVATEAAEPGERIAILPGFVEIMVAVGDLASARGASAELAEIASAQDGEALTASSDQTRGFVELAEGRYQAALSALRSAADGWQLLDAPYDAARARELIGLACRSLGDEDTAALELEAARAAFGDLGASRDTARVRASIESEPEPAHGLTKRELEVLRHLATGETNKTIAADLVLSRRTVDRHVSNIFAKLGVSSRAAATAHAYEHDLI